MKAQITNTRTNKTQEVEVYTNQVYFVDDMIFIHIDSFNEFIEKGILILTKNK